MNAIYSLTLLSLIVVISSNVVAAEWSGQFGIESRVFSESAAFPQQHGNNVSLYFQPEFYYESSSAENGFTFVPFVRWDQGDTQRSHTDIRELTWLNVQDNIEWRVGIRKVFWGVAESQHLVDIINQTDYVESLDLEEKLGQPMINLSYSTDIGSFDFFVLPYFRERTFAGRQGRLRSQPFVDSSRVFYESKDKKKHTDYAMRWAHSIDEWDIGLSYFTGTSREPRFVLGTDSRGASVLNPYYDIIQQTGIDIQATYNSWLWKLEAIHRSGISGTGKSRFNALTAGLEYTFYSLIGEATDFGIVIEYLRDDRGNLATTPFQKDIMLGFRFDLNDEQSSDILMGVIKDIDSDTVLYTIEANRRLTDNLKLSIEVRGFSNMLTSQVLYSYLKDDYIQFNLVYFF